MYIGFVRYKRMFVYSLLGMQCLWFGIQVTFPVWFVLVLESYFNYGFMSLISFPLCWSTSHNLCEESFSSLLVFRFLYVPSSNSSASVTLFYVHTSYLISLLNSHFVFFCYLIYHGVPCKKLTLCLNDPPMKFKSLNTYLFLFS